MKQVQIETILSNIELERFVNMKMFFNLFTIFIFGCLQIFSQTSNNREETTRIIYLLSAMQTSSVNEAKAVVKIITDHIKKKNDSLIKVEAIICENNTEFINELNKGFDLVTLPIDDYLRLRKKYKLLPYFTNETDGQSGYNYLLVVNQKDTITNIKSLKDCDITIQHHSKNSIPIMLLDKLLKEKNLQASGKYFRSITEKPTAQSAIIPLVLGKVKAALFTEQSLIVIRELNPQLEKQLKVIYRSPRLILGFSCINELKQNDIRTKEMFKLLTKLHEDEFGKQLMNLFVADKLVPVKNEDVQTYIKFFGEN